MTGEGKGEKYVEFFMATFKKLIGHWEIEKSFKLT